MVLWNAHTGASNNTGARAAKHLMSTITKADVQVILSMALEADSSELVDRLLSKDPMRMIQGNFVA